MTLLKEFGLDTLHMHKDGNTPFHRACWGKETRHTETVRRMLEWGVDPGLPTSVGKTCREITNNEATRTLIDEWQAEITSRIPKEL
jgi:ankyrin repeat protein